MCSVLHLGSRVFPDKESMMAGAMEIAGEIAARSPVAVQGTKINLLYSRDHSVSDSLNYMVQIHLTARLLRNEPVSQCDCRWRKCIELCILMLEILS